MHFLLIYAENWNANFFLRTHTEKKDLIDLIKWEYSIFFNWIN